MGSAGDSPAPVGDPPTGTVERTLAKRASPSIWIVAVVPSGESADGSDVQAERAITRVTIRRGVGRIQKWSRADLFIGADGLSFRTR